MEIHEEFTEWAVAKGVNINGIAAHRFPGRGLGIIAEKNFKASPYSSSLLYVCVFALLFCYTVSESSRKLIEHFRRKILLGKFGSRASDDGYTVSQIRGERMLSEA